MRRFVGNACGRDDGILIDLLRRTALKESGAFAELLACTSNKMRATARSVCRSTCDIEDVLQEGYLKVWKYAPNFDPDRASPITWMSVVIRNTAIDFVRARKLTLLRQHELQDLYDPPNASDEGYDVEGLWQIASKAMQKLPKDRRNLIELAYLHDESRILLAKRFNVPVGTIKTWLRRAILAVKQDCLTNSQSEMRGDLLSSTPSH